MECFKLFSVGVEGFTSGIKLGTYEAAEASDSQKLYETGMIASYPLYPEKHFSAKA